MAMSSLSRLACRVAALALVASAALASTMKQVEAAVPIPRDTEPIQLEGLAYKTMAWTGEVRTVRLEKLPEADAKQVVWILEAGNTRGSLMRVDIELHLLDADGGRIASADKTLLIPASTAEFSSKVKIKLAPGDWQRAEEMRLLVRFKSV